MQIKIEIPMSDLESLIEEAITEKYSDIFLHGAKIQWHISDNQREGKSISAVAMQRPYSQGKD